MTQFKIKEKQISVYPCDEPDRPVIYLNTFDGEGEQVLRILRDEGCPPFTLVSVSGLKWNHDMSPWKIPPVFKNAEPCTGGADDYLNFLIGRIIPEAGKRDQGNRAVARYSRILPCGLFSLIFSVSDRPFFESRQLSVPCGTPGSQNIFSRIP